MSATSNDLTGASPPVDEAARAVPFDVTVVVCARRDRAYGVN